MDVSLSHRVIGAHLPFLIISYRGYNVVDSTPLLPSTATYCMSHTKTCQSPSLTPLAATLPIIYLRSGRWVVLALSSKPHMQRTANISVLHSHPMGPSIKHNLSRHLGDERHVVRLTCQRICPLMGMLPWQVLRWLSRFLQI